MASPYGPTGPSVIRPLGYQQNRSCGYCKNSAGNSAYYASCSNMTLDHYQALVDRGWRRSGHTYYKPDLTRSCCPHYTIRLEAEKSKATKNQRKALNRWNRYILGAEYRLKAARLNPQPRERKRKRKVLFDLEEKVHLSEYDQIPKPIDPKTKKPIEPAHKFEIKLEDASFSDEKWKLFLAYQTKVHKEPPSRWSHASFKRFLCDGLHQRTLKSNGVTRKLGSYHQCYRLDGKLVAVAVLDLLPHAVSSVYLFYDPDYEQWEFGKLSALREISLTNESKYNYYYMGYYIPTCTKMRYKGTFKPTSLLDPATLTWTLLTPELTTQLDSHRYFSPSTHQANPSTLLTINTRHPTPLIPQNSSLPASDIDYTSLELDSDGEEDDTLIPDSSLFDLNVPGILTKAEIEAEMGRLGKWKLLIRNSLVDMEDLQGWEEGRVDEPQALKGIVAELAASLGWEVVRGGSVVDLFGLSA